MEGWKWPLLVTSELPVRLGRFYSFKAVDKLTVVQLCSVPLPLVADPNQMVHTVQEETTE